MEVTDVPGMPGKYNVYLNGSIVSCWHDTDCPGAALCAIGQEWQVNQTQGMCMCNGWYGFTGAKCEDWCSQAHAILGIMVATSVVALIAGCTASHLLMELIISRRYLRQNSSQTQAPFSPQQQRPRRPWYAPCIRSNPITFALAFSSPGGLLLCASGILQTLSTVGFAHLYIVAPDPLNPTRQVRRTSQDLDYASSVVTAIAYCFCVCTVVTLPITWIDVTHKSLHLKNSNVAFVISVSITITVIIIAVQLPLYITSASNFRSISGLYANNAAVIIWGVVAASILILNLLAIATVIRFERSPFSVSSTRRNGILALLSRIKFAAINFSIMAIGAIVTFCGFGTSLTRRYYTDPRCYLDTTTIMFRVSRIFVTYGLAVAVWYLNGPIRAKVTSTNAAAFMSAARSRNSLEKQASNNSVHAQNSSVSRDTPLGPQNAEGSVQGGVSQGTPSDGLLSQATAGATTHGSLIDRAGYFEHVIQPS